MHSVTQNTGILAGPKLVECGGAVNKQVDPWMLPVWDERGRRPAGPAKRVLSTLASSPESSSWKMIGGMESWNGSTPLDGTALVQLPIATMRCSSIWPIRAAIDRHVRSAS